MNPVLAEMTTNTPIGLAAWLACAAFIIGLTNGLFKLVNNMKGKQPQEIRQPIEIKASDRFVHKDEFEKAAAANATEHHNIFSRIGGLERGIRAEIKTDTAELHEKINDVAHQNAAQEAKQDLMNQRLVQMDGKIDRLIERKS